MPGAEEIWRTKTDEQVLEASRQLADYTEEGERFIRTELLRRGLTQPPPTHRPVQTAPAGTTSGRKAAPDSVFSHWSTLIENLQESPQRFYQSVEVALKARQIPSTENTRIEYREGGVLSARREYLHVERGNLVVDICGAPFGTGFFVSWWLAEAELSLNPLLKVLAVVGMLGLVAVLVNNLGFFGGLLAFVIAVPLLLWLARSIAGEGKFDDRWIQALPGIGWLYTWLFKPATYYRIDTTLMFQKAVHNAVQEVVDELTKAKGLRALSESERKPIMREFYQRKMA